MTGVQTCALPIWLYVEDHCSAIYKIITESKKKETYCVGGGTELNNNDVVNKIADIMKEMKLCEDPHSLIKYVEDRKGHDFRYSIDSIKIKESLKWIPKYSFESSIIKTIESFNFKIKYRRKYEN